MNKPWWPHTACSGLVVLDQSLKFAAVALLPDITHNAQAAIVLIPHGLFLGLAWDPAFSFGLGNNLPPFWSVTLFGVVPFVLAALLAVWYARAAWSLSRPQLVSMVLLLGGMLGNTTDRWFHNGVVANYLGLGFLADAESVGWVTNLADVCTAMGLVLALWAFRKPVKG